MATQKISRRPQLNCQHLPNALHPRLKQIYADRGVENASQLNRSAKDLLHYQDLNGIKKAVSLLVTAIKSHQKIIVVGDFDADGATSTALSMMSLRMMGSQNHDYLVPNRFDFGYGLSPEIVEVAAAQKADLIMTVDNGIACFAGVEKAKSLGITVIIAVQHLAAET